MSAATIGAGDAVLTPRLGRVLRRSLFWIAAGAGLLLLAGFMFALQYRSMERDPLGIDNPAPEGGQALASVLVREGVEVRAVDSLDAIADGSSTLLFADRSGLLGAEYDWSALLRSTQRLVLVDPPPIALQRLGIAAEAVHALPEPVALTPGCDDPAAARAGRILVAGTLYRLEGAAETRPTACYPQEEGAWLLRQEVEGRTVIVLGGPDPLSNGGILLGGNAALALGVLGTGPRLDWYLPGFGELRGGAPGIAALTPPWVTPLMTLLLITATAAALWRGRRLGALVLEPLPVTIPASETTRGRARLYRRQGNRLRAADALRIGALRRAAAALRLPRHTPLEELIDAIAAAVGERPAALRPLLAEAEPQDDRGLVAISDALLRLEAALAEALGPASARPEPAGAAARAPGGATDPPDPQAASRAPHPAEAAAAAAPAPQGGTPHDPHR